MKNIVKQSVKNRTELTKLIENLKKQNIKPRIQRSIVEGMRYDVSYLKETNLKENINLKKYGFVRAPEADFSDDGNRFTCYYYDPEGAGDKRIRLSKHISRDGDVYLSARYYFPETGRSKYWDELNGVSLQKAAEGLPKLKSDIDDFLTKIDEFNKVTTLTDEQVKEIAEEIKFLEDRAGLKWYDAEKRAYMNKDIEYDTVPYKEKKKVLDFIRNSSPYDKEELKKDIKEMITSVIYDLSNRSGYNYRGQWESRPAKSIEDAIKAHKGNISDYPDEIQEKIIQHISNKLKELHDFKIESLKEDTNTKLIDKIATEIIAELEKEGLIESLKESKKLNEAKIGDKVKIIFMDGEPKYSGKEGIIEFIDDAGQLHGTWGGCALIPGVDEFKIIATEPDLQLKEKKTMNEKKRLKIYRTIEPLKETNKDLTKVKGTVASVLSAHSEELWAYNSDIEGMRKKVLELLDSDEIKNKAAAEEAKRYLANAHPSKFLSVLTTYMTALKADPTRRNRQNSGLKIVQTSKKTLEEEYDDDYNDEEYGDDNYEEEEKDLPKVKPEEPIEVSTEKEIEVEEPEKEEKEIEIEEPEKEFEDRVEKQAKENSVNDLIVKGFDLIRDAQSVLATLIDMGEEEDVIDLLQNIIDKQNVVIGMLSKTSEVVGDGEGAKSMKMGSEEAAKLLGDIEELDDIDIDFEEDDKIDWDVKLSDEDTKEIDIDDKDLEVDTEEEIEEEDFEDDDDISWVKFKEEDK